IDRRKGERRTETDGGGQRQIRDRRRMRVPGDFPPSDPEAGWMKVGAEPPEAPREALERAGAGRREANGAGEVWRYALDGAQVTLWRTGTVRVQGKGEGLEPLTRLVEEFAVPDTAPVPMDLPRDAPWAGVDESGKGDYFGPLVSAAVVVDP